MNSRLIVIFLVFLCNYLTLTGQDSYLFKIKQAAVLLPTKPVEADSVYKEILEEIITQQVRNDSLFVLTYFQLGLSNLYQGKLNIALDYYDKSLQYNRSNILPNKVLASLANTAIIYEKQYRFKEASETYQKVLEIAEQRKDSASIAGIWLNLGILSHRMKDDEKALTILGKTYTYYSSKQDTFSMGNVLNNIATCYFPSQPKISEDYLKKSLALYKQVKDEFYVVITTNNLVELNISQKQYSESRQLLQGNIVLCEKKGFLEPLSVAHRLYGQCEIESGGDLETAAASLGKARELALKTGRNDYLRDIQEAELLLQVRIGSFVGVKKVLEDYKSMIDESAQESARIINTEFQTIHEVKTITQQNDLLEEGISVKNKQLILSLLALIAAALAIGIITAQYIRLRRTMKTMYRMNVELANSSAISIKSLNQDDLINDDADGNEQENISLSNLYIDVLRRIESDKLYLNPVFSLQELSEMMRRRERYISKAISEIGKTSFPSLINNLRINEARRLLADNPELPIMDLMKKTGFGSRQSLYRNFKQATGFSPSEYQQQAKGEHDQGAF